MNAYNEFIISADLFSVLTLMTMSRLVPGLLGLMSHTLTRGSFAALLGLQVCLPASK